jgi:hypothetical protein
MHTPLPLTTVRNVDEAPADVERLIHDRFQADQHLPITGHGNAATVHALTIAIQKTAALDGPSEAVRGPRVLLDTYGPSLFESYGESTALTAEALANGAGKSASATPSARPTPASRRMGKSGSTPTLPSAPRCAPLATPAPLSRPPARRVWPSMPRAPRLAYASMLLSVSTSQR